MFKYIEIDYTKNQKKIAYAVLKYIPETQWNSLDLEGFKEEFSDLGFEDDQEAQKDKKRIESLLVGKLTVDEVEIYEEYRGKGYSKELYLYILEQVRSQGFRGFYSDTYLSDEALRMWESFVFKGLATKEDNRYYFKG